eukprot:GEMP01015384.1.p1 GENE.GEMP01015384.1~~GEMP01015384.1.p1  ORF type:complete len:420 (+),score=57.53 GEMP01015384.1:573-1832(+)
MDGTNAGARDNGGGQAEMLGVGAIIGSGLIALLIIPGICALFSPQGTLTMRRKPLGRDMAAYTAAICVLIHVLAFGKATTWHSIFYFLIYGTYLAFMIGERLRHAPAPDEQVFDRGSVCGSVTAARLSGIHLLHHYPAENSLSRATEVEYDRSMARPVPIRPDMVDAALADAPGVNGNTEARVENDGEGIDVAHSNARHVTIAPSLDVDFHEPLISWRRKVIKTVSVVWIPMKHLCKLTMPDCELGHPQENLYFVGFLTSFAYVALFSFIITTSANSIVSAISTGKSSTMLGVWGILLVSVGAEVPDAIQAVTAAKRGHGSMAASSCIGSQVCNLCIGFGFPWFIVNVMGHPVVFAGDVFLSFASACLLTIVVIFCLFSFGFTLLRNQPRVVVRGREARVLLCTYACIVVFLIALSVAL